MEEEPISEEQRYQEKIEELIDLGVLGEELPRESEYRHWPVLQPDKLPQGFGADFEMYGAIRLY